MTPLLVLNGVGDAADEGVGNPVAAAVGDDLAKLGLKAGRPRARLTEIEMQGDLPPTIVGQLAVEVVVQLMDRLVTVDSVRVAGTSGGLHVVYAP